MRPGLHQRPERQRPEPRHQPQEPERPRLPQELLPQRVRRPDVPQHRLRLAAVLRAVPGRADPSPSECRGRQAWRAPLTRQC